MPILIKGLRIRGAVVRVLDFGGLLTPSLGGATQRVNRLGTRYAIDIELPPLPEEPDGRVLTAMLEQALTQGASFPLPKTGLRTQPAGSPVISATTTGGSTIPISGLTPNYQFVAGQFLSIIHGGRRYLHRASAATVASDTGTIAALPIVPLLRCALAINDVVEAESPTIEGWVDIPSWSVLSSPHTSVRFSITEAA